VSVRGRARRRAAGPRGQGSHRVAAVASVAGAPGPDPRHASTRTFTAACQKKPSESVSRIDDRFEARENTFDRDIGSFRFEMRGSSQQK
jgi:hypothetical protein